MDSTLQPGKAPVKGRHIAIALVGLLLVWGAFLRLYDLGGAPYWMDEGYTVNATLSVQEHGSTILDSGQNYSCPLYCYPSAAIAKVFGDTAFSYRLEAALAGILFILVFFLIVRDLFSIDVALLASTFVAFSYYQIAWSRQARFYSLFELFFWPALYFFYKAVRAQSKARIALHAILAAVCTIIACLASGLGYLLPFIFIGWFAIDRLWLHPNRKQLGLAAAIAVVIAVIAGIFEYSFLAQELHSISLNWELPRYVVFYGLAYWAFLIPGLAFLLLDKRPYKEATNYLLFAFGIYLFCLSFLTAVVQYRYLFALTPVFFILASLGTVEFVPLAKWKKIKLAILAGVLLLFFVSGEGVIVPQIQYFLESDNPNINAGAGYYIYVPQPDWNAAYAYIEAHETSGDAVVSSMPQFNRIFLGESGYWIEYDYYIGIPNSANIVQNGREFYADAAVLPDLASVQSLMNTGHGFIVFDYYATDQRISPQILAYIQAHAQKVFYEYTNPYSQVWVYQF